MKESYKYYPTKMRNIYTKWYDSIEEDMEYRCKGGQLIYTKLEILAIGEIDLINT